ncbi:MAG: hypothetical protein JO307_22475 [Bryobacterales bacterium]|nr:hypothetical protein [Bryobacterales bacterium]MBV9400130.1 hypothetical protein [Bryobacterales bacterium]
MPFNSVAEPGLIRQVFSVLAVFALLGGALWKLSHGRTFLRVPSRLTGSKPDRILKPIDRLVLTPHHTLHLVRLRGQELVIATYPNGCCVLGGSDLPPASVVGNRAQAGSLPHVL